MTEPISIAGSARSLREELSESLGLDPLTPEEEVAAEEASLAALRQSRRLGSLRMAGVPAKHAERLVAGGEYRSEALDRVRGWLAGKFIAAVLWGAKGVGKTFAGSAAVDALGGVMINASRLCQEALWLKGDERGPLGWRRVDFTDRLPLVVVDDLGNEAATMREHVVDAFTDLLVARCNAGLRTLVTTNLTLVPVQLATWGPYLGDRLEIVTARLVEYGVQMPAGSVDLRARERSGR